MTSSILRTAHGTAARNGAMLVAETPPIDEVKLPTAESTTVGLAVRKLRGRPFAKGNRAGADHGPSLARLPSETTRPKKKPTRAEAERRRVQNRAKALERARVRELTIQSTPAGATSFVPLSSGVRVELSLWALAVAWSRFHYEQGDSTKGAQLAERASAHHMKAIAYAERDRAAHPDSEDPIAAAQRAFQRRLAEEPNDAEPETEEPTE
jgi:hypothetical protein